MNAGLKKLSMSERMRKAAGAWVVCNILLGAAAAQAGEPAWRGNRLSPSAQRYAAQVEALQQARRRDRAAQQGALVPGQAYIVQQPVQPYLVPQPQQPVTYQFYDAALGIKALAVPGYGVQVLWVKAFSSGYYLGLEPGDVIVRINGRPVQSAGGLRLALASCHGQFRLTVLDVRSGTYQTRWGQLY